MAYIELLGPDRSITEFGALPRQLSLEHLPSHASALGLRDADVERIAGLEDILGLGVQFQDLGINWQGDEQLLVHTCYEQAWVVEAWARQDGHVRLDRYNGGQRVDSVVSEVATGGGGEPFSCVVVVSGARAAILVAGPPEASVSLEPADERLIGRSTLVTFGHRSEPASGMGLPESTLADDPDSWRSAGSFSSVRLRISDDVIEPSDEAGAGPDHQPSESAEPTEPPEPPPPPPPTVMRWLLTGASTAGDSWHVPETSGGEAAEISGSEAEVDVAAFGFLPLGGDRQLYLPGKAWGTHERHNDTTVTVTTWLRLMSGNFDNACLVVGAENVWSLVIKNNAFELHSLLADPIALGAVPSIGRWLGVGLSLEKTDTALKVTLVAGDDKAVEVTGGLKGQAHAHAHNVSIRFGTDKSDEALPAFHLGHVSVFDDALTADRLREELAAYVRPDTEAETKHYPLIRPATDGGATEVDTGLPLRNDAWFGHVVDGAIAIDDAPTSTEVAGLETVVGSAWVTPGTTLAVGDCTVAAGIDGSITLTTPRDVWVPTGTMGDRPWRWHHVAWSVLEATGGVGFAEVVEMWINGERQELTQQAASTPSTASGGFAATFETSFARAAELRLYDGPLTDDVVNTTFLDAGQQNRKTYGAYLQGPLSDAPMSSARFPALDDADAPVAFDDLSGNHLDLEATPSGGVGIVDDRELGRAVEFSASIPTTASVVAPGAVAGPLDHTPEWAASADAWLNPVSLTTMAEHTPIELLRLAISDESEGRAILVELVDGKLQLSADGNSAPVDDPIDVGQWSHLGVRTINNGATIGAELFCDGVSKATIADLTQVASLGLGLTIGNGTEASNADFRWASVRLFDRSLHADEFEATAASRAPNDVRESSGHVTFSLVDPREEPVLYLMTRQQTMTLTIGNLGRSDLHLPHLSGSPHEDQHHFVLRFREGVISDFDALTVTGPEGQAWKIESRPDASPEYSNAIFLTARGAAGESLLLPAGGRLDFTLGNVNPVANGATRGTRVELQWRNLTTPDDQPVHGTRLHYLSLVHGPRPSSVALFPLHASFVGNASIMTGDKSKSSRLTLAIRHEGHEKLVMPVEPSPVNPPTIVIQLPVTPESGDDDFKLVVGEKDVTFADDGQGASHWSDVAPEDEKGLVRLQWSGSQVPHLDHDDWPAYAPTIKFKKIYAGLASRGVPVIIRYQNFADPEHPDRTMEDIVERLMLTLEPLWVSETAHPSEGDALVVNGSLGLPNDSVINFHPATNDGALQAEEPTAWIRVGDDVELGTNPGVPSYAVPERTVILWNPPMPLIRWWAQSKGHPLDDDQANLNRYLDETLPTWRVCDGHHGTPDLMGKGNTGWGTGAPDFDVVYLMKMPSMRHGHVGPTGLVTGKVIDALHPDLPAVAADKQPFVSVKNQELMYRVAADGTFRIEDLPVGTHTLIAGATGYINKEVDITIVKKEDDISIVENDPAPHEIFSLSPILPAGEFRVVLTWKDQIRDVDSHIWTPGGSHVYYQHTTGDTATLDVDRTQYNGTETMTFTGSGVYTYGVHIYGDANQQFAGSAVRVRVFNHTGQIDEFWPSEDATGRYWDVFDIDTTNSAITKIDKYDTNAAVPTQRPSRG